MRSPARFFAAVAAIGCGLAAAQDGPAWVDVTPSVVSPGSPVTHLAVHPTDARRLIALGVPGGLVLSNDRGASWTLSAAPPVLDLPVERLFPHPGRPGVVFLQEKGGRYFARITGRTTYLGGRLYRSDDFGQSWTLLVGPVSPARDYALSPFAVDPLAPERIFASRRTMEACATPDCALRTIPWDHALLESVDGGFTWRDIGSSLPERMGATPRESVAGPTLSAARRLFIATRPPTGYATDPATVFASDDSARSWSVFATGFDWIRQDPHHADVLFASSPAGSSEVDRIQRSDDGGHSWREVLAVSKYWAGPHLATSLALDPVRPGRLWLTSAEQGVLLSEDSGAHWRNLGLSARYYGNVIFDVGIARGLVSSPADPETVYVLWDNRVMRLELPRADVLPVTEFEGPGRYWMSGMEGEALSQRYRVGVEGFVATGAGFYAWRPGRAPAGALGSCRFQGNPDRGQHSRFITLAGDECEALKRNADWVLEGEHEFFAFAPVAGACAPGLAAVMRLFNGKADVNHRYTTDPTLARTMQGQGWIDEGIVMCASAVGP